MAYRDPDTGRFITQEQWEAIEEARMTEFDDWDDFEEFDAIDEYEYEEV